MATKEQRELVNPKWLVRKIYALPGLDIELREIVLALWAHSNTFIEAEEARRGSVYFTCQASQGQLAKFCQLKTEKSVYSRLKRLNGLGIVEWVANRSHKSNEYHVNLDFSSVVMTTGDTDEGILGLPYGAGSQRVASGSSSVVSEGSSVVSGLSSVVEESSSVVQTTDSGFSGSYELAYSGSREQDSNASLTPSVRPGEPGPVAPPSLVDPETLSTTNPVHTAPPAQQVEIPPAAPVPPTAHYTHKWHEWEDKKGKPHTNCEFCACGRTSPASTRPCRPDSWSKEQAAEWVEQVESQAEGAGASLPQPIQEGVA